MKMKKNTIICAICLLTGIFLAACSQEKSADSAGEKEENAVELTELSDIAWLGFEDSIQKISQKTLFMTADYKFSPTGELIEYEAKGQGCYSALYQFQNRQLTHSELVEYQYDVGYEDFGKAVVDYEYVPVDKKHTKIVAKTNGSQYDFADLSLDEYGRIVKMQVGAKTYDLTYEGKNALCNGNHEIPMLLLAGMSAQDIVRADSSATKLNDRVVKYTGLGQNDASTEVTISYYE